MKKIALLLVLFVFAKTALNAQTINIVNNMSYDVGLYINYSTIPGNCATNKTAVYQIPPTSNVTYNVGSLTWAGSTPPAGGTFTSVIFSDDVWLGAPHATNSVPCGNSSRYDDGVVGDPSFCPWLTTNDCFVVDGNNFWIFPPANTNVSAIFTPGPNAVVTFN